MRMQSRELLILAGSIFLISGCQSNAVSGSQLSASGSLATINQVYDPGQTVTSNSQVLGAIQLDKGDGLAPATMRCALGNDQNVYCWGGEVVGQVNPNAPQDAPAEISNFPVGAIQVDGGGAHSCAIDTKGNLLCWGFNEYAEVTPNSTYPLVVPTPTIVPLPGRAVKVAVAGNTTCVIVQGETPGTLQNRVICWGKNDEGEAGNGGISPIANPTYVVGLNQGVIDIAAGAENFCVIVVGGQVFCWGQGGSGALGAGPVQSYNGGPLVSPQARPVTGLVAPATQITIGWSHACALLQTGQAFCWGDNTYGELGYGISSTDPVWMPMKEVLQIPRPIQQVSAGMNYTCAVGADSLTYCWGYSIYGRMGTLQDSAIPALLPGLGTGIAEVQAGYQRTCVRYACGQISCVGDNQFGELGDGTTQNSNIPVQTLAFNQSTCTTPGTVPSPSPTVTPTVTPSPVCTGASCGGGIIGI